jgi:hypothetical protein
MGQTLAGRGGLVRPPLIRLIGPPPGNPQDWTEHPTSGYESACCDLLVVVERPEMDDELSAPA